MSWYKVSLKSSQVANTRHMAILNEFEKLFRSVSAPKDMALFASKIPQSQEEFMTLYFSPSCSPVADLLVTQHMGTTCEIPKKDDVRLLVGKAGAWNLLE